MKKKNSEDNKWYWIFKYTQLILATILATLMIVFVALPQFTFDLQDGLLFFTGYIGISWFSNGIIKNKTKEKNDKH